MRGQIQISAEVRGVLARCTVQGNIVVLPDGQLQPPLYRAVNKVLEALGGKWNRSAGGHVFAQGVGDQLADALQAGAVVDQKRNAEQFFTPADLAARMAKMAVQRGDHVLEPSAGMGVLIRAALDRGAEFITAVESDAILAGVLESMVPKHGSGLWLGDFLQWKPVARAPINVALMNPPFSNNQDIAHVQRAFGFLRPGGQLVAIMSPHFTFAQDRASREFRALIDFPDGLRLGDCTGVQLGSSCAAADASVEMLPAGTFRAEGTNVASVLVHIIKAG